MKASKILLFIICILLVLGLISLSFPEKGIPFGKRSLYFPSISDVFSIEKDDSIPAPQRMEELKAALHLRQQQDSLYEDSLAFYTDFFQNHPSKIDFPKESNDYFNDLFETLNKCREQNHVIHILHYGDSQIEADRITGYIRQRLQEKFGGCGAGLLPAVQPIPSAAVGQTASENIERYIVSGAHQSRISHKRYGALGQVGIVKNGGLISISVRNWKETFENLKEIRQVRLFAGNLSSDFKVTLTVSGKKILEGTIENEKSPVNVFSWNLSDPIKKFTLRIHGSAEIYGITTDGLGGVAMDNIPFRGSSGIFFNTMDSTVTASMFEQLNVKLILLEFGGNMVPSISNEKSVLNYKEKMAAQINYLRQLSPDIKILVIGPADMSVKTGGRLQTHPYLESVVTALKEAALENDAAFWNMYRVMGGKNSMIDWVKNSPSLAAPDYIHFTIKGANTIAELFYDSFMVYYDYYTFVNEHKKKLIKNK